MWCMRLFLLLLLLLAVLLLLPVLLLLSIISRLLVCGFAGSTLHVHRFIYCFKAVAYLTFAFGGANVWRKVCFPCSGLLGSLR